MLRPFARRLPEPKSKVGPYRLVRLCGDGGQGSVWEARGPDGEAVALKAFDKPDARTGERIARELQLCAGAQHPHLVRVFDVVEAGNQFWVAMNFVEGDHLGQRVAGSGVLSDQKEFALVMIQIASALASVHGGAFDVPNFREGGYAHRDVKPRNVVVSGRGTGIHATLVDLSLVTALDGITTNPLVTVRYAAPEQLRGEKPSDRVDVYSLAATGFFLLSGRPPHDVDLPPSEAVQARLAMMEAGDPPRLSRQASAGWAEEYDALFAEALALAPSERPSALEMAKRVLAITWPLGAPHAIARIPTELEPAVREAAVLAPANRSDPWRPRQQLLDATDRAPQDGAGRRRQAALVERSAGIEAARPLYGDAALLGDPVASAWIAQDRENELGADAAIELWRTADERGSAVAARRWGEIRLAAGDQAAALDAFRRARDRRDPGGAFALARLLRGDPSLSDDPEEGRRAMLLAVELNHPEACRQAGLEAERHGQIAEAERLYQRADRGGDPAAPRCLATFHRNRGDLAAAEEMLQRAIGRGDGEAYFAYAYMLGRKGEAEQEADVLRRARRAGVPGAAQALARCLVPRDPAAAYQLLEAPAAREDAPRAMFTYAAAAFQLGRFGEATEALETLPGPGGHRLLLAAACLAQGRVEEAGAAVDSAGGGATEPLWLLELSEPALEHFAERPPVDGIAAAALRRAELARLRAGEPEPAAPAMAGVRDLYERGRKLGCAKCAAWVAHCVRGTDVELEALERAAAMEDPWAMVKFAEALYYAGEHERAEQAYRTAVSAGVAETVTGLGPRLMLGGGYLNGTSPQEELLWEAERGGSRHAAELLINFLFPRNGWRDPQIEGLLSRADLRGSALAADVLGLLHSSIRGDAEASEAAHRRAFGRDRRGSYAYNVAVMASQRGDRAEAERYWEIGADLGHVASLANLAELWLERGEEKRAMDAAADGLARADNVVDFHCLGEFFAEAGEHRQAADCFRRAHERGFAISSLSYSAYVEDAKARRVLTEGLASFEDDKHPLWHLYALDSPIGEMIRERLDALPKVGVR